MNFEIGHSRKSSSSRSYSDKSNLDTKFEDDLGVDKNSSKMVSSEMHVFCEDCSDFLSLKLTETEQTLVNKDKLVQLLQQQLSQLNERNIKSINDAQEINRKYSSTKQELFSLKQIFKKYEEELRKLLSEKSSRKECRCSANSIKEEPDKWKKQLELDEDGAQEQYLGAHVEIPDDQQNWQNAIHSEITTSVISAVRENSQSIVDSLGKQNKKLEDLVEKLQADLKSATENQIELEKKLNSAKNEITEIANESAKTKKQEEDDAKKTVQNLQSENNNLQFELQNMKSAFEKLQNIYSETSKAFNESVDQHGSVIDENEILKEENKCLDQKLSQISKELLSIKGCAFMRNKVLCNQLKKCSVRCAKNVSQSMSSAELGNVNYDENRKINENDESKEMMSFMISKDLGNKTGALPLDISSIHDIMSEIEILNNEFADMNIKLKEADFGKSIAMLENENDRLKDNISTKSEKINELESNISDLKNKVRYCGGCAKMRVRLEENKHLMGESQRMAEEIEFLTKNTEAKNETIKQQEITMTRLFSEVEQLNDEIAKLKIKLSTIQTDYQKKICCIGNLDKINSELQSKNSSLENRITLLTSENLDMKRALTDLEEDKMNIKEKLYGAKETIQNLSDELNTSKKSVTALQIINDQLEQSSNSLKRKFATVANKKEECDELQLKLESVLSENYKLKVEINKEKSKLDSLAVKIDSLNFFHENEMAAKDARIEELKKENLKVNNELGKAANKLIEITESEKKINKPLVLNNGIDVPNKDINLKEAVDFIKSILEEIGENSTEDTEKILMELHIDIATKIHSQSSLTKNSITTISEMKERKCMKSPRKVNRTSLKIRKSSFKMSKIPTRVSVKKRILLQKPEETIKPFKKELSYKCIDTLDNPMNHKSEQFQPLNNSEDISLKSSSLPNLINNYKEREQNESVNYKTSSTNIPLMINSSIPIHKEATTLRKSSSVDCLHNQQTLIADTEAINCKDVYAKCNERLEQHYETIKKLQFELKEVTDKLSVEKNKRISKVPESQLADDDCYKEVIKSLQKQVSQLQKKSAQEACKSYTLEAEIYGLKRNMSVMNEMEKEILKLREELERERFSRIQEYEKIKTKKEKELEILSTKLKNEFMESKQRLLSDLSTCQTALKAKDAEEKALKEKCDKLLKKVTQNQELRKKKLLKVPYQTSTSKSKETEDCSMSFSKPYPVVPLPTVYCATTSTNTNACRSSLTEVFRAELDLSIKKHRVKPESVEIVHSSSDEEFESKYLIK